MSRFYEKLADVYEDIFPLSGAQADFVLRNLPAPPAEVVDLGCSTGALARELARLGYDVLGVDLSSRMISQAESAVAELDVHGSIAFAVADMRELINVTQSVDALLCLGNTLVHLTDRSDLQKFLASACSALQVQGGLVIQIVNYDRVKIQGVQELPAIDGRAGNKLQRYYGQRQDGLLDFSTVLTLANGTAHQSEVTLLPLLRRELADLLTQAGFGPLRFYGSYQGAEWSEESFHTICVAEKAKSC